MKVPTPHTSADHNGAPHPSEALEDQFARLQPELLGTLFYFLGNIDDARDALQEAFIKCWKHRDRLAGIENVRAWIFRVVLNTARDLRGSAWQRKRSRLGGRELMLTTNEPTPHEIAEDGEQMSRLRGAVLELRIEEQEVFLLRQNGGLTYDEIATSVGIPLSTVKTRMRLAISKLRVALEESETPGTQNVQPDANS